jgi:hypothetical protein
VVVLAGMLLAIFLYQHLDKVLGLCGSILGTTVVLMIPSRLHFLLISKREDSKLGRFGDQFITYYSIFVMVFVTALQINMWSKGEGTGH